MTLCTTLRKATGLMLVLAAMSGTAMAGAVPEIDPGSALSALTLLTGGVLVLKDRRRAK